MNGILFFLLIICFLILIDILENISFNNKKYKVSYKYIKKKLMTQSEKNFYNKIKSLEHELPIKIIPQVNLAAIIDKTGKAKYRNELFRNIDFGIFDVELENILLLIELNDLTHRYKSRIKRDQTVKKICNNAQIKLITFYTNKPNEPEYLHNKIKQELKSENKIF